MMLDMFLKRNLISLGMLDQNGYCYKGENGELKVFRGSLVVMKGVRENGLYTLQGNIITVVAATVIEVDSSRN